MATLQAVQAAMTGFPLALSWPHFRAVAPSPAPPALAQTAASYSMSGWRAALVNGVYRVQGARISVSINRHDTWAVSAARTSASLLQHEQGHFDIVGLIARDLARKVLDLSLDATVVAALRDSGTTPAQHLNYVQQQFQSDIRSYGQQASDLSSRLQTHPVTGQDGLYDRQTGHSQNAAAQTLWNNRLARIKNSGDNFELLLRMEGVL